MKAQMYRSFTTLASFALLLQAAGAGRKWS